MLSVERTNAICFDFHDSYRVNSWQQYLPNQIAGSICSLDTFGRFCRTVFEFFIFILFLVFSENNLFDFFPRKFVNFLHSPLLSLFFWLHLSLSRRRISKQLMPPPLYLVEWWSTTNFSLFPYKVLLFLLGDKVEENIFPVGVWKGMRNLTTGRTRRPPAIDSSGFLISTSNHNDSS